MAKTFGIDWNPDSGVTLQYAATSNPVEDRLVFGQRQDYIDAVIEGNKVIRNDDLARKAGLQWVGRVPQGIVDQWYREWHQQGLRSKVKFRDYMALQIAKPEYAYFRTSEAKLGNEQEARRLSFMV